ncbi:MAG: thioesterase domain-containing protein, partial [Mycobacterium sp.]
RLQTVFADLSGVDPAILTPDTTFVDIGFDSLFLTQAASALQKEFATEITLRTLLDDVPTLNLLVERILPTLPDDVVPATAPAPTEQYLAEIPNAAQHLDAGSLASITQQLALISRQLEMLGVRPGVAAARVPAIPTQADQQTLAVAAPSDGERTYRPVDRGECVAFLREAMQLTEQQRAIVPLETGGTRTPIFALGGHNGDVFAYRALALHLGPDQPFFGLQPPGIDEDGEPLTRVEDMARHFAEQIRSFRPVGPITIAGFCAGGTIAFELARELLDSGADVTNLILFGAPYYSSYRRPLNWKVAQTRDYTSRFVTSARAMRTMSAAERARYVAERARRALPQEEVVDPALIRRDGVERATMAAVRAYSPAPLRSHVDFMIACESSKRSWAHPLRWSRHVASSTVFVGPDDCDKDTMLLPEYAPTFAAFVADAQRRHAISPAS